VSVENIIILGNGSQAEVFFEYLNQDSRFHIAGFTTEADYIKDERFCGLPIIDFDGVEQTFPPDQFKILVSVGYRNMNRIRQRLYLNAKDKGYRFASYIHPDVHIWKSNQIGENVVILEDNTIQPFVEIGDNTVLWSGNHIGHHSSIGRNCFISSHVVISGKCVIGDNSFIGVNATVRDAVTIGRFNLIGAGALVMESTTDKSVYVAERTPRHLRNTDSLSL
jgi:sugar O-acyltransferase (sialic acid O-acetyltransferase NeuD family)